MHYFWLKSHEGSFMCIAMKKVQKEYLIKLWNSFQKGNEEAFTTLYEVTFRQLLNYGLHICKEREVVEDCIQDLYVRIYLKEIKPDDPDKIRAFIYKALKNSLLNILQRNNKSISLDEELSVFHLSYTIEEELFSDHDMKLRLESLLMSLTEREREIIYLRYVHEMKIEEIALIQNMNTQSIRNSLTRSFSKVRKEHEVQLLILLGFLLKIYSQHVNYLDLAS
ncbi:MAG: RNA polymerase sigma factor [Bacteroidales bacterium]